MSEIALTFLAIAGGVDALFHCRGVFVVCGRYIWHCCVWIGNAYMASYLANVHCQEGFCVDMYGHVWPGEQP